jgi:hypothetical protein
MPAQPAPSLVRNLSLLPFTPQQKAMLDAKAIAVHNAPSYIHPDLSFFNPPSDSDPFTITPNPFPAYPQPGASPVIVIQFQVGRGKLAVINALAVVHFGGNPPDGTGQVIWRVRKNGSGFFGLNNLTSQIGSYSQPRPIVLTGIENDILDVTVELPATVNGNPNPAMPPQVTTAARFEGFTYPLNQATMGG